MKIAPVNKGFAMGIIFMLSCLLICGFCIFVNLMSISSSPFPGGATLYVGGGGPNNYTSIQDAIDDSSSGDLIFVYNGIYREQLSINKQIRLDGQTRTNTIIDGQNNGDVILIRKDNVEVSDVSIINTGIGNTAIIFDYVSEVIVHHCIIDNAYNGLRFFSSDYNGIVDNTIINSTNTGILFDGYSNGNTIVHNNFMNNLPDSAYDEGYDNIWYSIGNNEGNYWDDYTGADNNGDGIGDTPYEIPGGSEDICPLMNPYEWVDDVPVAQFEYIINGTSVFFNASDSYDSDGIIVSCNWLFGDDENGTGMTMNHTYSENGIYDVILWVFDNDGKNDSVTKSVFVGQDSFPPDIDDNTLSQAYTGDSFVFDARIVDVPLASNTEVSGAWVEYWYSGGSHKKTQMAPSTDDHYLKTITILDTLAPLYYIISANDTSDNWNNTGVKHITISDNDNPMVSNVVSSPELQFSEGFVNLTCTIIDNIGVSSADVNITYPNGFSYERNLIQIPGSDVYFFNDTYTLIGLYEFYMTAGDGTGNEDITQTFSFTISPSDTSSPRFLQQVLSHPIIPEDTDGIPTWGEITNISVIIDDESNISSVFIDCSSIGYSMSPMVQIPGGDIWYFSTGACAGSSNHNGSAYVEHNLVINATDEYGNWNVTTVELIVWKNGDVSGNGKVTLFDATYLAKWYLNVEGFEELPENVGEVSGNGKVTLFDATYLAKWYLNVEGFEELK